MGGPDYIRDTVAPGFFIGINDPLKPGFTNASFGIFAAWEPTGQLGLLARASEPWAWGRRLQQYYVHYSRRSRV